MHTQGLATAHRISIKCRSQHSRCKHPIYRYKGCDSEVFNSDLLQQKEVKKHERKFYTEEILRCFFSAVAGTY